MTICKNKISSRVNGAKECVKKRELEKREERMKGGSREESKSKARKYKTKRMTKKASVLTKKRSKYV